MKNSANKNLRKVLSIIICLTLVMSYVPMVSLTAFAAYTVSSGTCGTNVTWTLDSEGLLTISGTGAMFDFGNGTAPWFLSGSSIKNIVIGDEVTSIGNWAFPLCESLASVKISKSVTSIGEYAFWRCESLASIEIPNSVTSIGDYAFFYCTSLASVTIGNSVTSIGDYAFAVCTNLKSVTIGNSVTSIGECAFDSCTSLASIEIPNSVISIGEGAFSNCTSLASVTIGNSVTSIGEGAFSNCTSLASVTIGNSVTSIGDEAFWCCESLASIEIPNSVTNIGDYAFQWCTSLKSVTIGNSVTSIGECAFDSCTSLASITVDEDNKYYSSENGVLFNKDKTTLIQYPIGNSRTSYTIPNSVTSIGDEAFLRCTSLESVTIGNSVTSIGSAFGENTNLASIEIPNSVTSIDDYAFFACTSLASVTIGNSVTSIGEGAFSNCTSLASVTIPCSVTSIGRYAFSYCTSFENITVDEGNKYYSSDEYGVLFNNDKTTLIQYPAGKSGTSYTIPNSVTSIGEDAFSDCTSLARVTIPDSVTSIGRYAFSYCTSLENITVDEGNKYYSSDEYGVLFNNDKTTLIQYPAGKSGTSYTIPNSVTSIGEGAFGDCTSLARVTIPDGVTSIGESAFFYCTSLASVTIPDGVTSIGGYAFYNCTSLASVTIPDSVTSIDSFAFDACTGLTLVSVPCTWNENSLYSFDSNVTVTVYHSFEDGICTVCGAFEPATQNEDGYYEIGNAGQLMWFASLVNGTEASGLPQNKSANAKLMNDIDMDGIGTWSIMQTYDGTLDGNGYTIQGLNQNAGLGDGEQQGFIRRLTGTVKNTTFKNCSAFQQDSLGCAIIAYNNSGTISGCMVVGCNVQLGNYGGLALVTCGNLSDGVIENCGVVGGNITRRFSGINNQGMAAITEQNGGTVQNCFAYGFNLNNNDSNLGALVYSGNAPVNSYYYYSGDKVFDSAVESIAKTAEQFASGEVAYLLQQGNTEQVWGQDSNQEGATPILDSTGLYKVVKIGETGNYSVANVGDTNGDETVDVKDYQTLVNKALADDHEQIETASYDDIVKYDLDGDGYLDVLDVSLMERMINGHKTADVYAVGDYDLNGKAFEEADILAMAEAMKNPEDLATYQKYACDLNADGVIDILDLIEVNNLQK